jgi:hypothetical protein
MPIILKLSPPMYPSSNQSDSFRIVISNTRAGCKSCVCGDYGSWFTRRYSYRKWN